MTAGKKSVTLAQHCLVTTTDGVKPSEKPLEGLKRFVSIFYQFSQVKISLEGLQVETSSAKDFKNFRKFRIEDRSLR